MQGLRPQDCRRIAAGIVELLLAERRRRPAEPRTEEQVWQKTTELGEYKLYRKEGERRWKVCWSDGGGIKRVKSFSDRTYGGGAATSREAAVDFVHSEMELPPPGETIFLDRSPTCRV